MQGVVIDYENALVLTLITFRSQDLLDVLFAVFHDDSQIVERILGVKTSSGTNSGLSLDEITVVPRIFPAREAGGRDQRCLNRRAAICPPAFFGAMVELSKDVTLSALDQG